MTSTTATIALRRPALSGRRACFAAAFVLVWVGAAVYLAVSDGPQIIAAVSSMPWPFLLGAVLAQVAVVSLRIEAWRLCLNSAGSCPRRSGVYGAGSLAAPLGLINMQLAAATRIGALRRLEARRAPTVPALCAAELPIWGVEVAVGAVLMLFAAPALGLPWFAAPLALAVIGLALVALARTSLRSSHRFAAGLRVLADRRRAPRLVGVMALVSVLQVTRIWLLLLAAGLGVSPLDAAAVLIGQGLLSQLPIGSAGASGASIMIVGGGATSALAAAGLALTATELTAAVCFLTWSLTVFVPLLLARHD